MIRSLTPAELANGVDPQREFALIDNPPADKPRYAENYMLAVYDPKLDLGMWLHLGSNPDDFSLWEEQVLVALPGDDGLLWSRSSCRPATELKPAGPTMRWEMIEPFRHMHVHFDGVGVRTPNAEVATGRVRDATQELFAIDLRIEGLAPAWDNHVSATSGSGRGNMAEQSWASEHYEQTLRAVGTVRIGGQDLTFDGTGTRDHSRGQRGHKNIAFGGHNLWSAPFASGKAFGMQRMWRPDGTPTMDVGFVYIDGQFHHTDLISPPGVLYHIPIVGDQLELVMRSPLGEHRIMGVVKKTILGSLAEPSGFQFGADIHAPRGLFTPCLAEYIWDGELGWGLAERSGPVLTPSEAA